MSSAKRKPRTPSPLEDEEEVIGVNIDSEDLSLTSPHDDVYAGRRISVSEFEAQELLDCAEDVASPGASSTSSEPTYVRQPGFDYHAHEISSEAGGGQLPSTSTGMGTVKRGSTKKTAKKKKSNDDREIEIPLNMPKNPASTRPKMRREPLPMKMRALPQSFWVQPNRTSALPPSGAILPPLMLGKDPNDIIEVRPVTPPEEVVIGPDGSRYTVTSLSPSPTLSSYSILNLHHSPSVPSLSTTPSTSSLFAGGSKDLPPGNNNGDPGTAPSPPGGDSTSPSNSKMFTLGTSTPPLAGLERRAERIIKVGNTDLLFSLFDKVEQNERKRLALIRRGRPRRLTPPLNRTRREEDPCMVGGVTEGILPLLTDPSTSLASSGTSTPLDAVRHGHQVLEMISLREGDRTLSLPSLHVERNYSQILSELVMKL